MADLLKIQVIYFAKIRELTGLTRETFIIKKGSTPSNVLGLIEEKHSIDLGMNFKIAINDEFSDWDFELRNGDNLVFIPPVTGG